GNREREKDPLKTETRSGGVNFRFAPILTATVLTILLLWMFKTVVAVFLLLLIAVLLSLYFGAIADWLVERARVPEGMALAVAILGSISLLALLLVILIPPVIAQTKQMIEALPTYVSGWEAGL